jgi:hypothetical protein
MYASKHALFVGPGHVPQELDAAQLFPAGGIGTRRSVQAPRLWSSFESAAEAERAAAWLLSRRIESVVAGPEQPPVEDSWHQTRRLTSLGEDFSLTLEGGAAWPLLLGTVAELSSVVWRGIDGSSDLGVLLRVAKLDRPVFLRSRTLGPLGALLEACGRRLRRDARIRHEHLTEASFGDLTLTGDLLPLAVGVVDAIDTRPGELPGRPRW